MWPKYWGEAMGTALAAVGTAAELSWERTRLGGQLSLAWGDKAILQRDLATERRAKEQAESKLGQWLERHDELANTYNALQAEAAAMRAVLTSERHDPQNCPDYKMEGGIVTEIDGDEWVCVHCGGRGYRADNVEHEADCFYVAAGNALNGTAGTKLLEELAAAKK